jgi:uncharacterized protein YggE
MQMRIVLAAALVTASSTMVLAPPAAAQSAASLPQLRAGEVLLEVDGFAFVSTPATSATLSTTVWGRGTTEAEARSKLEAEIRRISDAAQAAGAVAADIAVEPPIRGNSPLDFDMASTLESAAEAAASQVFRSRIVIRLRDASRARALYGVIGSTDATGSSGPSYELADDSGPRREARRLAIAAARADAESLAEAVGMRIVRTLRVTERAGLDFTGMFLTEQHAMERFGPGPGRTARSGGAAVVDTIAVVGVDYVLAPR